MKSPEERLVELAGSVSDGGSVDWRSGEHCDLGQGLQGLETLSQVAAAFGSIAEGDAAADEVLFRWGPLEVLEKLGEGRFGEVFRAFDPQVGRQVALKLSRGQGTLVRTWLDEAQRLASVRHANVVTVFGAAVHDQRAGIWTDLLDGKTLEQRLTDQGPLGAAELVAAGGEMCRALAAVHAAGLVHGDIKTSNVVRDQTGKLVLVDFGAARSIHGELPMVPQGTPSFLAPEVAAGEATTPASDLYALGAVLFRLATSQQPSAVASSSLRDLRPDLPAGLVTTIDALLARDPADRPASAGQAERRLLEDWSREDRARAEAATAAPDRRRVWLVTAASMLVLMASVIWRAWDRSSPPPGIPFQASLWSERSGSEVRLSDGAAVRPGDRLALTVELEESAHLYVFNEDQQGNLFVLFPLPGLQPTNPLEAGRHRLPGALTGEPQSWEVTSAGGKEHFLIVAAEGGMPRLEKLQAELERARRGRPVEYAAGAGGSEAVGETLRGIGGLRPPADPSASLLGQLHSELLLETGSAVWAELLVLDNPS